MSRTTNLANGSFSTNVPVRDPADITHQFNFDLSDVTSSIILTVPPLTTTIVGTNSTQTLTNKTIIGAGITGGTIQGAVITGGTLIGVGITGGNFNNVHIYNSGITGGTIQGASITGGTLMGAGITGGTMQGTVLSSVSIYNSGITGGTMQGSAITGGTMQGTVLSNVSIYNSGITGGTIQGSAITGGTMQGSSLSGLAISNSGMSGGTIQGSDITGGTMQGSSLSGVTISNSGMSGGTIQGSAITGGTLMGAGITGGTMQGTVLSNVSIYNSGITGGTMQGTVITGGTMQGSSLSGVYISNSGMSGGTIQGSAITGGTLIGAGITGGTMQGTVLSSVVILNSGITGGTIQGTTLSNCTIQDSDFTGVSSVTGAPGQNITITPASGYNLVVDGNLEITGTGTRTNINSVDLNIKDNFIYLNSGYTSVTPLAGGIVSNIQSTGVSTTVDGAAFSSTTVVEVTDTTGINVGSLVQVVDPNNPANAGIYQVDSLTATSITIDTAPSSEFSQVAFIADSTVAGTVNVVFVTVLRADETGDWQIGANDDAAVVYATILTTATGEVVSTNSGSTTNSTPVSINILSGVTANTSYFVQVDIQGVAGDYSDSAGFRVLGNGMTDGTPVISQLGPTNDIVKFASLTNTWIANLSFTGTSINVIGTPVGFTGASNWRVRAIIRQF